jgi:RNA polymerase sigma-70 factor (ECF subfamily)
MSLERHWVRRAREGDAGAFEALYRAHAGRVYALCLRMTADPGRAEELTQETFVRAWEKLGTFRGDSGVATWLHRLTVNVVLGDLRARRRLEERFVAAEADRETAPEPSIPPPETAASLDLERALATLPPQARMIFVLHDVEGYRHGEIAELTGLAEGTSKAHLHHARKRMKEALRR